MNPRQPDLQRRLFIGGAVATVFGPPAAAAPREAASDRARAQAASQHFPFGPVLPPRRVPAWPVTTQRSVATDLASLLRGKVTALQLMFTGCSATCPLQGALFAQAKRSLHNETAPLQLLSISIDALSDTPAALNAWLGKFGAQPGWLAAVPRIEDVDRLFALLGEGGEPRPRGTDPHTGQVYVLDRSGSLVYRTPSLPKAQDIVTALRAVAARGPGG